MSLNWNRFLHASGSIVRSLTAGDYRADGASDPGALPHGLPPTAAMGIVRELA